MSKVEGQLKTDQAVSVGDGQAIQQAIAMREYELYEGLKPSSLFWPRRKPAARHSFGENRRAETPEQCPMNETGRLIRANAG